MPSERIGKTAAKLFVVLIGSILLLPSAWKLYMYYSFLSDSETVFGIIEDPLWGGDMGGRPFIEYKDLQGRIHGFRPKAKTHWFYAPQKGEKIKVFFLKNDPKTAIADSVFHHLVLPLFFGIIGGAVIVYSLRNDWNPG